LAVVVSTAVDVLFNLFDLPLPNDEADVDSNLKDTYHGPMLIWGGSCSVDISIIQLERAAGCRDTFVTASSHRHDLLKSLGATACFDYSAPDVISQVTAAVKTLGLEFQFAADAIGSPATAQHVESCSSPSTMLVSTTRNYGRFKIPFATRNREVKIRIPDTEQILEIPANAAAAEKMQKALLWAVANYDEKFSLPSVDIFDDTGEKALEKVKKTVEQGRFGKVVLRHPFDGNN
jgi:NADPH:quinone reductase-like Zn-dependent oxidoreductase